MQIIGIVTAIISVVTFIANTQRGRYTIPPEVADSWELVDSYTIDDVDMIQFWKQN